MAATEKFTNPENKNSFFLFSITTSNSDHIGQFQFLLTAVKSYWMLRGVTMEITWLVGSYFLF